MKKAYRFIRKVLSAARMYLYDLPAMMRSSSLAGARSKEAVLANLIMLYHIIEKGLTMPDRHLAFGKNVVIELIDRIRLYEDLGHPLDDIEYRHAVGVLREYLKLHIDLEYDFSTDADYWNTVKGFEEKHRDFEVCEQWHFGFDQFYSKRNAPFDEFAKSRHTCRHYRTDKAISMETIESVVRLAQTAPSACNRQHVRVHCIADEKLKGNVFALQGGNRGFGHLADKILLLTSDISCLRWSGERYDLYTNAGFFAMNLCYALHFHEIACCILHWSVAPERDRQLRGLLGIPDNERIVCMLSCGIAPDEFDVATSQRKDVKDILKVH